MKIESTWDFNVESTSDPDVESSSESDVDSTTVCYLESMSGSDVESTPESDVESTAVCDLESRSGPDVESTADCDYLFHVNIYTEILHFMFNIFITVIINCFCCMLFHSSESYIYYNQSYASPRLVRIPQHPSKCVNP